MSVRTRLTTFLSPDSFRVPPALFIFLITAFSLVWFLGYEVYQGDQLIYFPDILKKLDPGLFSRDILFGPGGFTFFDDLVAFGASHGGFSIFSILIFLTVVTRFVYFYSLYRISLYFTGNRMVSLLAPLMYLSGFVVYGTGMRTIEPALLPKYMALAFCLLGLTFLFESKIFRSALALGIGFLFHPTAPLPFLLIFYAVLLMEWKKIFSPRIVVSAIVPPLFLAAVYFFVPSGSGAGLFGVIDEAWRQVILRRDSYYFVTTWYYPNSSPLYLAASIFFFFLVKKELTHIFGDLRKRRLLLIIFFVPMGLAILSMLLADFAGLALVLQLSLARGLILWKIFFNGLFAYYGYLYVRDNPRHIFYNFLLLGIVFSFVVSEKAMLFFLPPLMFIWFAKKFEQAKPSEMVLKFIKIFPYLVLAVAFLALTYFSALHGTDSFLKNLAIISVLAIAAVLLLFYREGALSKIFSIPFCTGFLLAGLAFGLPHLSIHPGEYRDQPFMEACEWIKKYTSQDALFLTEPFSGKGGAIRLLCYRSLFATRKDGGQVVFDRDYALEWNKRYDIIKELEGNQNPLLKVAQEYNIDYVFSEKPLAAGNKVFDNGVYYVYKLQ